MTRQPDITTPDGQQYFYDTAAYFGSYVSVIRNARGESIIEGYGETAQDAQADAAQNLLSEMTLIV